MLGDRPHALEYAARSANDLPGTAGGANREEATYVSAIALTRAGDRKSAVARMRDKFALPAMFKAGSMWCDPFLAPLRSDPAYRELLARQGIDVRIDPAERATWPPVWNPR